MRLRRDSQGNYTYQYTADEEQVAFTSKWNVWLISTIIYLDALRI